MLILPALSVAGGCALVDHGEGDGAEGYLSFGFEEAAFRPCGVSETWWVEVADASIELFESYQAVVGDSAEYVPAYARLIGSRSGRGSFGHMGAYDRTFSVSRVVEIREVEEGDCAWPG